MIRVLIAEDQHMIRGALVALLALDGDMEVVAELDRGDTIVDTARRVRPDAAVRLAVDGAVLMLAPCLHRAFY